MSTVILLLHLCLPNDGTTECLFLEEPMTSSLMCEQKVERLQQDFQEIQVFQASCQGAVNDL